MTALARPAYFAVPARSEFGEDLKARDLAAVADNTVSSPLSFGAFADEGQFYEEIFVIFPSLDVYGILLSDSPSGGNKSSNTKLWHTKMTK